MLTKPRLLLSLSKKIGFFYKSENNDNGNNAKDYSHNHANNHKNYDNKMNRGPFVVFSFYLCFVLLFFLGVAIRFYIYIYIYIFIYIFIYIYIYIYIYMRYQCILDL